MTWRPSGEHVTVPERRQCVTLIVDAQLQTLALAVDMPGVLGIGRDPCRGDQYSGTSLGRHHAIVLIEVIMLAAGGDEDCSKEQTHIVRLDTVQSVVWADQLSSPATATHSQPARNTSVAQGRSRRWRSFAVPPRATKPTTGSGRRGWSRTPALTTLA
jgi:hypothetical protein